MTSVTSNENAAALAGPRDGGDTEKAGQPSPDNYDYNAFSRAAIARRFPIIATHVGLFHDGGRP